ncbi:MAG: hypothetical protein KatS3mg111_0183 [Pirellulaceae bacterium]|nr:MAG: hypothetical protein KatS3mg111_0183 [Pirellulaceae bacterium]
MATQLWRVGTSGWLVLPAKPTGDGMLYESLAFNLWRQGSLRIDTSDPQWQAPYLAYPDLYVKALQRPAFESPATSRPPLWPLLIAAIYSITGRHEAGFMAVHVVAAVMIAIAQTIAVAITLRCINPHRHHAAAAAGETNNRHQGKRGAGCLRAHLSRVSRCLPSITGAVVACGLAALHGTASDYATDFLTEPLALMLMQLFILSAIWAASNHGQTSSGANDGGPGNDFASGSQRPRPRTGLLEAGVTSTAARWLLPGALFGLLVLSRSVFAVWLPGVCALVGLAAAGAWRQRLVASLSWLAGAITVCLPWWVRNCVVLGAFLPLGTQGPVAVLGGYNDAALRAGGEWRYEAELALRAELAADPSFQQASSVEREKTAGRGGPSSNRALDSEELVGPAPDDVASAGNSLESL